MSVEPEIQETVRRVVIVLERLQFSYAIGESVAMAFAGHVRATRDVDILVLVPTEDLILFKMIFHRSKDIEDARHLLAANHDLVDVPYVLEWIPRTLDRTVGKELMEMMRRTGFSV